MSKIDRRSPWWYVSTPPEARLLGKASAAAEDGILLARRPMRRPDRLVIASHNPGKVREIAELLEPHGVAVISAGELGLPEPEETAASFAGNAEIKARAAAAASG